MAQWSHYSEPNEEWINALAQKGGVDESGMPEDLDMQSIREFVNRGERKRVEAASEDTSA